MHDFTVDSNNNMESICNGLGGEAVNREVSDYYWLKFEYSWRCSGGSVMSC